MEIIANYFKLIPKIYEEYIYEDSMIGIILNENKIYPKEIQIIIKTYENIS